MTDRDQIIAVAAGDPWRLLDRLGVREQRGRFWCPYCQADGKPHRTPDFGLRPDGRGWACHKCGAKGDWLSLVQDLCKCGFREALQYIGASYGLTTDADVHRVQAEQRKAQAGRRRTRRTYPTLDAAIESVRRGLAKDGGGEWRVVKVWYYNAGLAQTRFQRGTEKDYRPMHKTTGGGVVGLPPKPWPLYRGRA